MTTARWIRMGETEKQREKNLDWKTTKNTQSLKWGKNKDIKNVATKSRRNGNSATPFKGKTLNKNKQNRSNFGATLYMTHTHTKG